MEAPYKKYSRVQNQAMPINIYDEICAKLSKLGSEILMKIGLVKQREGQDHFQRFRDNRCKWSEEDY